MTLRLAGFGVRGFVGESLTPHVMMDFASAFGTLVEGGRVLLGRDTRGSSPMFHAAATAALTAAGCEVLDFGICPTPILQFAVPRYEAAGAVSISGGHNGMGWNALTLIGKDGAYIEPLGGEAVLDGFHAADFLRADAAHIGASRPVDDYAAAYFKALESCLDAEAIRRKGFKVLIDPVGGAGCPFLDAFAQTLNLDMAPINAQPSAYLAREPEPRPRSALQMASIIRYLRGDVGFVLSSDMSRLSLVTEAGEPASEEYTPALIAAHVLRKQAGPVAVNCCTTRTVDDLAAAAGVPVIKTKVGQAYVVSRMTDEQGVVGLEGSGSAAWPRFSRAFDGFLMMGLILEAMAERGEALSRLLHALPRYHIVKKRLLSPSRRAYHALDAVLDEPDIGGDAEVDLTDGVRLDWPDGWAHVRVSRTEQVVRVISEAVERASAEERAERLMRIIGQAV